MLADRAGRYTGKPRPALVMQADLFSGTGSVVVCLITSTARAAPAGRSADRTAAALQPSWVQIEKLAAVSRQQIAQRIRSVDDAAMLDVARKLTVLLGIAGYPGGRTDPKAGRTRGMAAGVGGGQGAGAVIERRRHAEAHVRVNRAGHPSSAMLGRCPTR